MVETALGYFEVATRVIPSIGIVTGAGVTLATFLVISLKNARKEVLIEQMNIYSEFWSDKHAETRKRIAVDVEYADLKKILDRRKKIGSMSGLNSYEYGILEELDQFLAVFVRIESLYASSRRHRGLGDHLEQFRKYWRESVQSRPELSDYICSAWPALSKFEGWNFR